MKSTKTGGIKVIDAHMHLIGNARIKRKKYLEEMKNKGVNYALAIADDVIGGKDIDITINELKTDKRFFVIGSVDILNDNLKFMIKKLNKLFKTGKIRGIKLFPGHEPFYPNDKKCFPFYKLCIKYNLPILVHTGGNPRHLELAKYNDPKNIIKVAKKFPQLKIVICHYFFQRMEYCYQTTKKFNNIYFDTSALGDRWVTKIAGGRERIIKILKKTIKNRPDKVLFGTDWPCKGCTIEGHKRLIDALNLDENDKENVYFNNANRLFHLNLESK